MVELVGSKHRIGMTYLVVAREEIQSRVQGVFVACEYVVHHATQDEIASGVDEGERGILNDGEGAAVEVLLPFLFPRFVETVPIEEQRLPIPDVCVPAGLDETSGQVWSHAMEVGVVGVDTFHLVVADDGFVREEIVAGVAAPVEQPGCGIDRSIQSGPDPFVRTGVKASVTRQGAECVERAQMVLLAREIGRHLVAPAEGFA